MSDTTSSYQSSSRSQSKLRNRPTRRKPDHHEPMALRFITGSSLAHFKGKDVNKIVRSHAMDWFRRQPTEEPTRTASGEQGISTFGPPSDTSPLVLPENLMSTQHRSDWIMFPNEAAQPCQRAEGYTKWNWDEQGNMRMMFNHIVKHSGVLNTTDLRNPLPEPGPLVYRCLEMFVSNTIIVEWLPAAIDDARLLLSSILVASTWLDMGDGLECESLQTQEVKSKVLAMTREHLQDKTGTDDVSVMVYINLLIGEMWNVDEAALRSHQKAIANCVDVRGEANSFMVTPTLQIGAAYCLHCDLVCQTQTYPDFEAMEPSHARISSPLFFQSSTLLALGDLRLLISDMCSLGDIFICYTTEEEDTMAQANYRVQTTELFQRLASLPSASSAGHPFTDDWMYEACRLASIIYTGAILQRIAFPEAADTSQNCVYIESLKHSGSSHPSQKTLSDLLYEALQLSDTANAWEQSADMFYWACTVGVMSSRTKATMKMMDKPKDESTRRAVRIRRYFTMHATRSLLIIIMVFGHCKAAAAALKKLLKLQRLVAP